MTVHHVAHHLATSFFQTSHSSKKSTTTMWTKPSKFSEADASKEAEEEDIGALIYRESQLRKKEDAAAGLAKKRRRNSSSSTRRSTSTRQATAGRKDKNSDEMIANSRHQREADIHLEMTFDMHGRRWSDFESCFRCHRHCHDVTQLRIVSVNALSNIICKFI